MSPADRRTLSPDTPWPLRALIGVLASVLFATTLVELSLPDEAAAAPNDLLLVTSDGLLTGRNADLDTLFQSFGWTVTAIDDDAAPSALISAAESSGVVYVAAGSNTAVVEELAVTRAPVVSEDVSGWDELMSPEGSTANSTATSGPYTDLDVVDASHPITTPVGAGAATVFSSGQAWGSWNGSIGAGMTTLATRSDSASELVLITAESGAAMINGDAEHRRVFFGLESAPLSSWNATLEGMVERALDWAAAGTANSGPPISPIGDLVMVTGTGGFGESFDALKRNLFESFGWTVTALSEDATAGEVTAAATANDVMFASDTLAMAEAYDIRDEDIGIVNEHFSGWSGHLNAPAQGQSLLTGTAVDVVEEAHPITSFLSAGTLTIHTSGDDITYWDSGAQNLPVGVDVLVEALVSTNFEALLVAESGTTLYDSYTAVNRRVWVPSDSSDPAVWTPDYETLMERSLLWAASFAVDGEVDSDGDGLWDSEEDANTDADDDPATNPGPNTDGDANPNYLDADDDGDGTPTASENPDPNGDGDPRDAIDSDFDGEPDYLDEPTNPSDGSIATVQKISDTEGTFGGILENGDAFGRQTVPIGDLDGDGIVDLAAGAPGDDDGGSNRGALYILFMNADGTVSSEQKISDTAGSFSATLDDGDTFGESVGLLGDLNGDGRNEIIVGANGDDDGGGSTGAAYVLFLNANGTVDTHAKISDSTSGVTIASGSLFGESVIGIGDVNADGVPDVAVGALSDSDGGSNRGAVHILFLDSVGGVVGQQKISDTAGDLTASLSDGDAFGSAVGAVGDLDGDGTPDIIVGARDDDTGGSTTGAAYVLFLDPDGTVKAEHKISATSGDLTGEPAPGSWFGRSLAGVGDIDGDGNVDALVGAPFDGVGGSNTGATHLLFLRSDGTVRDHVRYDATSTGLSGQLDAGDEFGTGVGALGDLDDDGTLGVLMTARYDDDGGSARGAVYVLDLAVASSVVTVNSTGDGVDATAGDGVCSTGGTNSEAAAECTLRAAIQEANASASVDTIEFNIPDSDPGHVYYQDNSGAGFGAPVATTSANGSITDFDADYPVTPFSWWNIDVTGQLPATTGTVTIDGTTQPGWQANTATGGAAVDAILPIVVTGDDFVLFEIGGTGSTIRGINASGGNSSAIVVWLSGTGGHTFEGSWAQIGPVGTTNGPGDDGVYASSDGNQIGGPDAADRVVIGNGFSNSGLYLNSNNNTAQNVWIGAQVTGSDLLPGYNDLPVLVSGDDNVIGTPSAGVVASSSINDVISLVGDRNTVQASSFGFLPDGTASNEDASSVGGNDNMIGGVGAGEGNRFATGDSFADTALQVSGGTGNSVLGNTYVGSLGTNIDIGPAGVNANDAGDADVGDNDLLNHPVITTVTPSGPTTSVDVDLDVPAGTYRIEFYADDTEPRNPSGFSAGETFVGAASIVHTGSGEESFSASIANPGGYWLSATATEDLGGGDFGSTSEFGPTDCVGDSDGDGLCDGWEEQFGDTDGDTTPNELDADDDDDGVPTASENADPNGDGDPRDAIDSDRDGEPDYLDVEAGRSVTPIADEQKISDTAGGLAAVLDDSDFFGSSVAGVGDVDGDGINDIVVGAEADDDGGSNRGAAYVLFLDADGTVKGEQKISDTAGGLAAVLDNSDVFGSSVAGVGDVDGDGINDIVVGAEGDDDGGSGRGAVYVLFLDADGTVKGEQKISSVQGGLTGPLDDFDVFGSSVAGVGDVDGDGINDIVVGAEGDDDGGSGRGAVYVLFLDGDGTVKGEQKISSVQGGLIGPLDDFDVFGSSVAGVGDVDGDGINDIVVGAYPDDDGGSGRGAVYVLFLDADGTVKGEQKISSTQGGLTGPLDNFDFFGWSVAGVGDVDGDRINDIVVGAFLDDDGGSGRGAVYVLFLDADGTVKGEQKISSVQGGLTGPLDNSDSFGSSVAGVGDLDGDGALNLAVGALDDDDGGSDRGGVYILDLAALVDSDGDGLWDHEEDANTDADGDPATNPGPNTDGDANPNYLDADDDGDSTPTASENADPNGDGDPRDARDSDRDGEPDYLDIEAGPSSTPIADEQKISDTAGGLAGVLDDSDYFGSSVASVGDVDGDGINDIVVGAFGDDDGGSGRGAVHVLFLDADGTVKGEQKISDTAGGLAAVLDDSDVFGSSVAGVGDVDGDGINDIVVGAYGDDDGGTDRGAVYVLFLDADGTVKGEQKISSTQGGLTGPLDDNDVFGYSVAGVGDVDGDGINDIAVGAYLDDDGGSGRGAVYVLFLDADGTVKGEQKISDTAGGLAAVLDDFDVFGSSVAGVGDVDGDGINDIVVGAFGDGDGGSGRGAVHVLFLDADGSVKGEQKISSTQGGLTGPLDNFDYFGSSVAGVGDVDGDGINDIVVGAYLDDDGGSGRGAVYVLFLDADGTVTGEQKISSTQGGLTGPLDNSDFFGFSVAGLGDLDGDGALNLAVGAHHDEDGGSDRGAVYILDLTGLVDSDGDGLWDHEEDANTDADNDPATNPGPNTDGDANPNYLDADDDGDGIPTASENADPNGDGDPRDALDSDRDGEPDYLDVEAGPSTTPVADEQKISDTAGGLAAVLDNSDFFGSSVAGVGDVDGDGINDVVVGAYPDDDGGSGRGAVYVLFLDADGTVKGEQKISSTQGGLAGPLDDSDFFGSSVAGVGDIDGDGINDVVVGANSDDDGGSGRGAVYVLFLDADGTVKGEQKISSTQGGLTGPLDDFDSFGAVAGVGDLDGDGINDIVVGASGDDDGGTNRGAVYVLFLDADGTVKGEQKISDTAGGLAAVLDNSDFFGSSVAGVGDVDGDGINDIVVGAYLDDDGGSGRGAVYVLFLDADGTVKGEQKISDTAGGLAAVLDNFYYFGSSVAGVGDVDGDGINDIVVGAFLDGDGGTNRGAVYVLFLDADGTVKGEQKISSTQGGLTGPLDDSDFFGFSVAGVGDLDGDGALNLAVGALNDDDGGSDRGGVYILDFAALVDSDGDGLWDHEEDANTDLDDDPSTNPGPNTDGDANPNYLDADDDGDGIPTASENADPNGDGDPRDALDSDRDGEPDYLDVEAEPSVTPIVDEQKISATSGGFTGPLDAFDDLGTDVAAIGDIDGDGINDLAVGAPRDDDGGSNRGAVYILFLNADGTVKAEQKISSASGGLTGPLADSDQFGDSVASLGDVDGDGVADLVVGAWADDGGGSNRGAVYVLFLNADGTVKAEQKIADGTGGLTAALDDNDYFGNSAVGLGDLDGDGVPDLAVGANGDDDGGSDRGAVHVLFLNADGTVKAEQKISALAGGFTGPLADVDQFGWSVAAIGDVDADGIVDLAVGAPSDDDGGGGRGAVYVLSLNADGTVKAEQKISSTEGGLGLTLVDNASFGLAVAGIGDLDGDGTLDLAVSTEEDGSGNFEGQVHLIALNTDGTAKDEWTISSALGGLTGPLDAFDKFGSGITGLGDLDGDGALDLAVGAEADDDGASGAGAVYVLDLTLVCDSTDSDSDGIFDCHEDANADADVDPATNPGPNTDGDANPNYLDADDDGDGTPTASENADPNSDGDPRDARDSDRDGEPDYLDAGVGSGVGFISELAKISDTRGGFATALDDNDRFGGAVASIGDLDGDGVADLIVGVEGDDDGGTGRGAAYVLLMNADGSVKADQKISSLVGGGPTLADFDAFGTSVASLGDLDGDGIVDVAVSANGRGIGAVFVLFLNTDGSVRASQEIGVGLGGFADPLTNGGRFGIGVAGIGDLDDDGINDLVVGDDRSDQGGFDYGAVYVLFLNADGTVRAEQEISAVDGGLTHTFSGNDEEFGGSVAGIGDIDSDGVEDIAVGSVRYRDGGGDQIGAVHVLLMNSDGTVKDEHLISSGAGTFPLTVFANEWFGGSVAGIGDIDADGVSDLLIGAEYDRQDPAAGGSFFVVNLNSDGTVKAASRVGGSSGPLAGEIDLNDSLGNSVTSLGDIDGDGRLDLAVGVERDDDGGNARGAVYVLELCLDTDGDGLCDRLEALQGDTDGDTTQNEFDTDDDGDGTPTASENADPNGDGDPRDALDTDRDGQPDYLDAPTATAGSSVVSEQKISDTAGGLSAVLDDSDGFGSDAAPIGDLDGDGIVDVIVGADDDDDGGGNRGAVYVLFMNADGTVRAEQKISDSAGGLSATLADGDSFGSSVAGIGDLDGDGVGDVFVGADQDDTGGGNTGAAYVLLLNADGTVKAEQKIASGVGGLAATPNVNSRFGSSVAGIGDLDGDGVNDVAVGAVGDTTNGSFTGAVYVLFLNLDGTVKAEQKITNGTGGLTATIEADDTFGSVAGIGDLDGDGVGDLAVGAYGDDDGGSARGAVYVLFMNADGTVRSERKISDTTGGLSASLADSDFFGISVGALGDVDADGFVDIVVGATWDSQAASRAGAAYVLSLSIFGSVMNEQKITEGLGGFNGDLDSSDFFGTGVGGIGDLDGDGAIDLMVTASSDDDGGSNRGAVYVLELPELVDSDGDGLWDHEEDANTDRDGDASTNPGPNTDGDANANYLDADDDGDGTPTASENADPNGDGDPRDARDSDRDGEPDYLDAPTVATASVAVSDSKISDLVGGLSAVLDDSDRFGGSVASIGDLDGDGVADLVVGADGDDDGASGAGAVYVLFMNADGTVKAEQKISASTGGLSAALASGDNFGASVAGVGDVDGDGLGDVAVGAYGDDDGGANAGAVYVLLLNADGTVRAEQKISALSGGFGGPLGGSDLFGSSLSGLGDLDGDGVRDLAVGAVGDDDGSSSAGAVYVLLLNADGSVRAEQKISATEGGLMATLEAFDNFGGSVSGLGDLDADGVSDLAVSALLDDDGAFGAGAVYVLFLNADGSVKAEQKISNLEGGLGYTLPGDRNFGNAVAGVGDLDADGNPDLLVSATRSDIDDSGEVWVLLLEADGTVKAERRIGAADLASGLDVGDGFGASLTGVGDLDGDGSIGFAAGALNDDDGGSNRGAVYVLDLGALVDSDGDGLWDHEEDADTDADGDPSTSPEPNTDGDANPNYLDADDDGDGTPTASENADPNGDGDPRDAQDADFDGQPDYLDRPSARTVGSVGDEQKISDVSGGFTAVLDDDDWFGRSVASIGDLDGDGVVDLIASALFDDDGGADRGAMYVLFMDADGTVRAEQKISDLAGGLSASLDDEDRFGSSVASIGDLDGDGRSEVAVGAYLDDDGDVDQGAVYVLFLDVDGTVRAEQKVSELSGGLAASLDSSDRFGGAVAAVGDLDGDGIPDLAVGAHWDDDGGSNRGAVYVLFLNADGTVKAEQKISDLAGGLAASISGGDRFGRALGSLGDLDGDGLPDLLVGASDDGAGAVYVLFLNADGTVKSEQKISDAVGGLSATLDADDLFGRSVTAVGDLDQDGVTDVVVGASNDDDGGVNHGAVYVLLLNSDGTVKSEEKISSTSGNLSASLDISDSFGVSVAPVGDLDGDGTIGIVIGAHNDDDGGTNRGAVYVLNLQRFVPDFVVNSTGDASDQTPGDGICDTGGANADGDDECTLRAAIEEANAYGDSTVSFNIPSADPGQSGNVWTVSPATAYDAIVVPITIDGSTQPTWATTPVIEIDGTGTTGADGLRLEPGAEDSMIRSLAIGRFDGDAIQVEADRVSIVANHLGADAAGLAIRPVGTELIDIDSADDVRIGGPSGDGNLLTAGGNGVVVQGSAGLVIEGNTFGTDVTGTAGLGSFGADGIRLASGSPDSIIIDNIIGSVGDDAIDIRSGSNNATIQGNSFGTDPSGSASLPISDRAIQFSGTVTGGLIGGTGVGDSNTFANLQQSGAPIAITSTTTSGISILGNTTEHLYGLIDLGGDGETTNDPLDVDAGANDLLNHPDLAITSSTTADSITWSVDLDVTLDVPAGDYRIEIFDNDRVGYSGVGTAGALVHSFTVVHPGGGAQTFSTSYSGPEPIALTSTATEDVGGGSFGSTSELSRANVAPVGTATVNSTGSGADADPLDRVCDTGGLNSEGQIECTLRAAIEQTNFDADATIAFNIPTSDAGYLATAAYWTIDAGGGLPDLLGNGLTIDGSTQPTFSIAGPVVQLIDAPGDGFDLHADDITLQDLSIGSPGDDGVQVLGDRALLDRLWVGIDPTGAVDGAGGAGSDGVLVYNGSDDVLIRDSRIAGFANGIASNSGTVDLTVTGTEVFENRTAGVMFEHNGRMTLLGNSIYDNEGLGFELDTIDGVPLVNDAGDGDSGPNDRLNKPIFTTVIVGAGTADLDYVLDVPAGTYRIEFFDSDRPDPTGFGEGQTFLSAETIVHPGGSVSYSATVAAGEGDVITATATPDLGGGTYGGTSEFSNGRSIGVVFVNSTADTGDLATGDGVCDTGSTNADGNVECTLRAAMEEASASTAVNVIHFDVPGSDAGFTAGPSFDYWTISPASNLPIIDETVDIDATTQTGWSSRQPAVTIDLAATTGDAVVLQTNAGGSRFAGLRLVRAELAMVSVQVDNVDLHEMVIGVAEDGQTRAGQNPQGTSVTDAHAVFGLGNDLTITDSVLSASSDDGIQVDNVDRLTVTGTYVGTGTDGTGDLGNHDAGIVINGGVGHRVGLVGDGNVLAWHGTDLRVRETGAEAVVVANLIGSDLAGNSDSNRPVRVQSGAPTVVLGGTLPGEGNTIEGGVLAGVTIEDDAIVAVLGNSVVGNGGLGIDLANDSFAVNDPLDADSGPNGLLNFPEIVAVGVETAAVRVTFDLDVPAGDYRIEAFTNPSGADPTGYGEGEVFAGAVTVTHAGAGAQRFEMSIGAGAGDVVSMTATQDLGGGSFGATSEFSQVETAAAALVVEDISVRGSDLRAAGGATPNPTSGIAAEGVSLDGGLERLVGPATDLTSGTTTMSAWIERDTAGTDPRIISKGTGAGVVYELLVDSSTDEAVARLNVGGVLREVRGGAVSIGSWHQVTATWDGATIRLFVNGDLVDSTPATGALSIDLDAPLVIGNTELGTSGFDGSIDQVELHHRPWSSAETQARFLNGTNPAAYLSLGGEQLGSPEAWTTSTDQSRSGGSALAAPLTAGGDAWITAIGVDEPGVEVTAWWWVSAPSTSEIAISTRTGTAPTDQFEAASGPGGLDLAVISGNTRTLGATSATAVATGTWQQVRMSTDELGVTSFELAGTQEMGPVVLSGLADGSVGFRAADIDPTEQWFIDDVRVRRLVSDEPATSLGPLERN